MFSYNEQPLPFDPDQLEGKISKETLAIHHDKLYVGYVNKTKEIEEKLASVDLTSANQVYSQYRGLKTSEAFARNGVTLHESYFSTLGNTSLSEDSDLFKQITKDFGSLEDFKLHLSATGMSVRGWAVCAWDTTDKKLHIYGCDAHDQGGIWGAFPVLTLDVYEHAYFIDYGSDRKSYIEDFWNNINWAKCDENFKKISSITT
ncbi:MAG: superoxide dismutase [Candidatus Gracilibacteria bacterium]